MGFPIRFVWIMHLGLSYSREKEGHWERFGFILTDFGDAMIKWASTKKKRAMKQLDTLWLQQERGRAEPVNQDFLAMYCYENYRQLIYGDDYKGYWSTLLGGGSCSSHRSRLRTAHCRELQPSGFVHWLFLIAVGLTEPSDVGKSGYVSHFINTSLAIVWELLFLGLLIVVGIYLLEEADCYTPQITPLSLQRWNLHLCQTTDIIPAPSLPPPAQQHQLCAEPARCNYFQSHLRTNKIIFQILRVAKVQPCVTFAARGQWVGWGSLWIVYHWGVSSPGL